MAEPTFAEDIQNDLHDGEQRYLTELEDREKAADDIFMASTPYQGHPQQPVPPGLGEEGQIREATEPRSFAGQELRAPQKPQRNPVGVIGKLPTGRPIVRYDDGSVSTHQNIIVNVDGKERLIPTMFGGKEVSEDEAIKRVAENGWIDPDTNEPIPSFDTVDEAEAYEQQTHRKLEEQARPFQEPIGGKSAYLTTEKGRQPGIPFANATPEEPQGFARASAMFSSGLLSTLGNLETLPQSIAEISTALARDIERGLFGAYENLPTEVRSTLEATGIPAVARGIKGAGDVVVAGIEQTVGRITGGLVGILNELGQAAQKASQEYDNQVAQKTFTDKFFQGAGSFAGYWIPAIVTGGLSGMATQTATALAVNIGTITESFSEANDIYQSLKPLVGEAEAAKRAGITLAANLVLLKITNSLGIGAEAISKPLLRLLAGAYGEGLQEVIQYDISRRQFWLPDSHPQAKNMLAHGWQQGEGIVYQPYDIKTAAEVGAIGAILGGGAGFTQALALGTSNMREAVEQKIQALEATELGQMFMESVVRDERGGLGRLEPGQPPTPGVVFPPAQDMVDGRTVLQDVPNTSSISSSFNEGEYETLPGIREVPMDAIDPEYRGSVNIGEGATGRVDEIRKTRQLAEEIKASNEISPLIIAVDSQGPYVLEGGHRLDALISLGAKSFPALVVLENDANVAAFLPKGQPAEPQPAGPAPVMPAQPLPESAVREGGALKKVYHGTSVSFEQFDPAMQGTGGGGDLYGPGFYFTENPEIAGGRQEGNLQNLGYASAKTGGSVVVQKSLGYKVGDKFGDTTIEKIVQSADPNRVFLELAELPGQSPNVRPAYLDIRNPFRIDEQLSNETIDNVLNAAEKQGYDVENIRHYLESEINKNVPWDRPVPLGQALHGGPTGDDLYQALQQMPFSEKTFETGISKAEITTKILEAAGYDGITHIGGTGENTHRVWIAFSPEQVIPAFSIDAALQAMRQPVQQQQAQADQSTLNRWRGYIQNETGAIGGPPGGEQQQPQSPADILSRSGQPFKRRRDAINALSRQNATETHDVVPVEGGFVGRAKVRTPIPPPPPTVEERVMQEQFMDLLTRPDVPSEELIGRPDHINFDHINTQEDVKQLIAKTRQIAYDQIETARRGTMTRDQIVEAAKENIRTRRFTIDRLLQRQPGEAMNAEDIMAGRMITVSLGQHFLNQLSQLDPNNSATWAAPFKTFNVWMQVASQLYGITAESGRGQNAFIPDVTGEVQFVRELAGKVDTLQTGMTVQDFKEHMLNTPTVDQLAEAAQKAPGYWDMFLELLYGIRLSGLHTHARNLTGNTLTYYWNRAAAGLGSHIFSDIEQGESRAMAYGTRKALRDIMRVWGDVEREMPSPLFTRRQRIQEKIRQAGVRTEALAPELLAQSKVEGREAHPPAITSENLRKAGRIGRLVNDRLLGSKMVDFIGATARLPGEALNLEDTLYKVMNYQAIAAQLGYREGVINRHLKGKELWQFVDDYIANMPPEAHAEAKQITLENVFQEKLGTFAHYGEQMINYHPAIRAFIMFYRTPINIAKWATRNSPLGIATRHYQERVAMGGHAAAMAKTKLAMGTTLFMAAVLAGLEGWGRGRGPSHPETRKMMETGGRFQQYSIYVPILRKWVAIQPTDPLGMIMGGAFDMAEIIKNPETWRDNTLIEDAYAFLGANIMAATRNVTSKTWATSARDMLNLFAPQEYEQADEAGNAVNRFIERQIASLVPAVVSQTRRATDPVQREIADLRDAVWNRLPFLSETLPPARNIFAHPRISDGSLGPDFLSPIFMTDADRGSPAEREMARLAEVTGARFPGVPRRIVIEGKSIKLTGKEREKYAALIAGYNGDPDRLKLDYHGPLERTIEAIVNQHKQTFPEPNLASERVLADNIKNAILASKKAAGDAMRVTVPRLLDEGAKRLKEQTEALPIPRPSQAPESLSPLFQIGGAVP